jgi:F-type H+-transporting ATPase subunit b
VLIDWFTVGAQALNFAILVWLLKRFLYAPILAAIDAREERVAAELADADAKRTAAQQERDDYRRRNQELDQQREQLMTLARSAADAERRRLGEDARTAIEALTAKRKDALANEARHLNSTLTRKTQAEVLAIARKVLADLAGASLEERITEVFIQRVREMDSAARARLARGLKAATRPALVRSAFDLPAEQRAAVQKALTEVLASEIPLRFETAPEIVGGIELATDGQKVCWSVAEYLGSLEKELRELLGDTPSSASSAAASEPKTR